MEQRFEQPGSPLPFGAHVIGNGVNFTFFSSQKDEATLHVFDLEGRLTSVHKAQRTGEIWHLRIVGLKPPFAYGWKIGQNPQLLLDPFSKAILSSKEWMKSPYQPLSLVKEETFFDWEGVKKPQPPLSDLVLYEVHLRGFTNDPSSQLEERGTFDAFIQKIPHLKKLGVNAIELLPIFEFYEGESKNLCNYWGYSTVHFFSPTNRFGDFDGFRRLVKCCHQEGILVLLDVVFNHTAESGHGGPTYHFKEMGSDTFYLMTPEGDYSNFTGCGNTLQANHPHVLEWVIAVLRHWVIEAQVDGFRFDLASCLKRGEDGNPLSPSPLIEAITEDPILKSVLLIAEPWDAKGLYEPGYFYPSKKRWLEWNSEYRDTIRSFIRGDFGQKGLFATRISGSEDMFYRARTPLESLNFITCHDGFTLRDLVSYNKKHNEENLEDNLDGTNDNRSWNCGIEGETEDLQISLLRERQMKNFIITLLFSQGTPMLLSGDEYGHTKEGNNNTWCQDNRLNWFQWDTLEKTPPLFEFTRKTIAYRQSNPHFKKGKFLTEKDITWHGRYPLEPNWNEEDGMLAFTLKEETSGKEIYVAYNVSSKKRTFTIPPPLPGKRWGWVANTGREFPRDFLERGTDQPLLEEEVVLIPQSVIVLETI